MREIGMDRTHLSDQAEAPNEPAEYTPDAVDVDAVLRAVLNDVLGLDPEQTAELTNNSGLFGELPELDSMAVAGLLTELEDRLNIIIEDDEVDGEMLETFGGLLTYAQAKVEGD